MKKKRILIFLLICLLSVVLQAQESIVKHAVLAGETVVSIAQKYKVTPNDLYQLNPDLVNGIKESQIILIPVSTVSKTVQLPKKEVAQEVKKKEEVIYYTVQAGETKFGLAKRFAVSIAELEYQNPHIVSGLQAEHKLQIRGGYDSKPDKNINNSYQNLNKDITYTIYTVLPNETLYGISKRHGITVSELQNINKDFLNGILKSGQSLRVPSQNLPVNLPNKVKYHLVVAGETKYGLSKRYGVSIDELELRNPQIVRMLQTGQQLVIPDSKLNTILISQEKNINEEIVKNEVIQEKAINTKQVSVQTAQTTSEWVDYEILPKQTLYGLSKMTGLTTEKLIEKNPNLEIGVQAGMIIKIPGDKITAELASTYKVPNNSESEKIEVKSKIEKPIEKSIITSEQNGLLKTINKVESKEVTLAIPFSSDKLNNFLQNKQLTKNENPDLEFYVGAIMAIDSLKKMNVLVEFKTLEVEVNKVNIADVATLRKNKAENSEAILHFSKDVKTENIGEFASKNNIPFITNQIEVGVKKFSSTFVGIPSKNEMAKQMLNYIASKNGNLIVISDEDNFSNEDFIREHFPKARFINVNQKDVLESERILNELLLNRKNFIVLNTNKTGLILNATTILLKESTTYQIQLALLEPKESIVGEGLSDMRFKALKMLYPSYSKRVNSKEIERFEIYFSKKYNYLPTQNVLQGFDLTFDSLIRLFQDVSFEATAKDIVTEQVCYSFNYYLSNEGCYLNKGIYILQFDVESESKLVN